MKFIKKILSILLIISVVVLIIIINKFTQNTTSFFKREGVSNLVSGNGQLHVYKSNLRNKYNENFQLKGLSSHGIQWYYNIITYDNLKYLRDNWGINAFRIAMYTNEDGYISNPDDIKQRAYNIIDMCIDLDLYVIIDWHILSDNDPNIYIEESKAFFNETSLKYKDVPNLIYEICNEPNQSYVTWNAHIKPYSEEIIPIIRNNSQNAIILVGTGNWCTSITDVIENPLNYKNVMYTVHFYSGTHQDSLRQNIECALNNNIPVFISEWGVTDATGNSIINLENSIKWIDFMDKYNLSWINWSFSNKKENSAILVPEYVPKSNIDNVNNIDTIDIEYPIDMYLTSSGQFVRSVIDTRKNNGLYNT